MNNNFFVKIIAFTSLGLFSGCGIQIPSDLLSDLQLRSLGVRIQKVSDLAVSDAYQQPVVFGNMAYYIADKQDENTNGHYTKLVSIDLISFQETVIDIKSDTTTQDFSHGTQTQTGLHVVGNWLSFIGKNNDGKWRLYRMSNSSRPEIICDDSQASDFDMRISHLQSNDTELWFEAQTTTTNNRSKLFKCDVNNGALTQISNTRINDHDGINYIYMTNDAVFFDAYNSSNKRKLFMVDSGGTTVLQVSNTAGESNNDDPSNFFATNNNFYFISKNPNGASKLYGHNAISGVLLVDNIRSETEDDLIYKTIQFNGDLYFSAMDLNFEVVLYRAYYDIDNTFKLVEVFQGQDYRHTSNFILVDDNLFFTIQNENSAWRLFQISSDDRVREINPLSISENEDSVVADTYFKNINNFYYYQCYNTNGATRLCSLGPDFNLKTLFQQRELAEDQDGHPYVFGGINGRVFGAGLNKEGKIKIHVSNNNSFVALNFGESLDISSYTDSLSLGEGVLLPLRTDRPDHTHREYYIISLGQNIN